MTPTFDGSTYDEARDYARLKGQLGRVFRLMSDGRWRTLRDISDKTGGSEASISARLRDLRKAKFGSHVVLHDYISDGLWRYRLVLPSEVSGIGGD